MKTTTRYMMNDAERAERTRVKALHHGLRAAMHEAAKQGGQAHRYGLLAWAFARQVPYRRVERQHHVQVLADGRRFEHNLPEPFYLAKALAPFFPEIAADIERHWLRRGCTTEKRLAAWIADPSGAIAAPAPRPKRVYQRPEPLAAE